MQFLVWGKRSYRLVVRDADAMGGSSGGWHLHLTGTPRVEGQVANEHVLGTSNIYILYNFCYKIRDFDETHRFQRFVKSQFRTPF